MRRRQASRPFVVALLAALLLTPLAGAAPEAPHENFARAATDATALALLGETLLNVTEDALTRTVDEDDANATRRARLLLALTGDLELIASLSDVESAGLLAPYVGPYTGISRNATNVTVRFQAARAADPASLPRLLVLARDDVAGMFADADAFDALGHDTTRLRELLALLLDELETIRARAPADPGAPVLDPPYLLLALDPDRVPLGRELVVRAFVVASPPPRGAQVRLVLDGAPWRAISTDAGGTARTTLAIASDERLGTHLIEATAEHNGRTLRANATFEVTKVPTILTLSVAQPRIEPDRDVVLRGRLTDDRRAPIPGSQGELRVDDGAPRNVSFLADGSVLLRLPAGELALGPHEATLSYAGDARHEPATAHVEWEIVPAPVPLPAPRPSGIEGFVRAALEAMPLWVLWALLLLGVVAVELGARVLLARHPRLFAPGAAPLRTRAPLLAREPVLPSVAPDDPRRVILAAYRDVLVSLAREGVPIDSMTHREVGRELERRGHDPNDVREATLLFERVRYAGEPARPPTVARFLPLVLRLTRPRRSRA